MKKALGVLLTLFATSAFAAGADDAAIIAAVDNAYVHGVHIDADPAKMKAGMDDAFIMFVLTDKGVTQLTRDAWAERLTASKSDAPRPKTTANIKVLDQSGNAAVAKVDLFRDGKQIFTDYISLYRVNGEWKLVGKVFHRH